MTTHSGASMRPNHINMPDIVELKFTLDVCSLPPAKGNPKQGRKGQSEFPLYGQECEKYLFTHLTLPNL